MTNNDEFQLLDRLFDRLFPLLRSISGEGIEHSLSIFAEHMPLTISGTPSGTEVFDWIVPEQ
jgi:aminopeptidase-like protein